MKILPDCMHDACVFVYVRVRVCTFEHMHLRITALQLIIFKYGIKALVHNNSDCLQVSY